MPVGPAREQKPEAEEYAPAKVNLALHVLGRRADGYHLLDSLVVFADIGDTLRAAPAEALALDVTGPFAAALAGDADNLALRAARRLAAAALRLLARLWHLPLPSAELALALGADVPVCLAGRPARMAGIGEALAPAPALPPCGLLLVNPGVAVATPAVFRARSGPFSPPLDLPDGWADAAALAADLARLGNDLEAPAVALAPAIGTVLAALRALPGTLLARMSGSGATCFALFATAAHARQAATLVTRPGWWAWGGAVLPPP